MLYPESLECTLATEPIVIATGAAETLEDGEYWIIADNKVATHLTKNYGYLDVVDAVGGKSTAANAFTFTQVDAGLYTIQDSNGKYYYQTGNYNSFNVADEDGMTDEFLWEVYDSGNGQFVIVNYEVGKCKTLPSHRFNIIPRLPEDARILVVYEAPAGYDYYQFKFCYIDQNWGWNAMTSPVDVNEYGCVMLDPQKTEYVLALNDEDIAAINAGKGMVIQGYGAVITKVSFCALVFQCSGRKNKRFSVSLHFHQRTKRYFYEQEFHISSDVRSDICIDILRQTGSGNPSDTSGTGDA